LKEGKSFPIWETFPL
jgi:hypothetical protein